MDTTQLIAWYGALVATIVAIINISTAWRDRSRIVVTGKPGMRVTANAPYDPTKDYIVISPTAVDEQQVLSLRSQGLSLRAIGKQVGVSRTKVQKVLSRNPRGIDSLEPA